VIALVDYGAGNLTSVRKALSALGAEFATPTVPGDLAAVDGIVIPGVGHFDATAAIDDEWRAGIHAAVARGTAVLGICLGMQWLFEGSDEAHALRGLGLLRGTCVRLTAPQLKVPHVGWNSLAFPRPSSLMHAVPEDAQVYFTHSYVAPIVADTVAVATHGTAFSAAVAAGRIAGVQFHPEKSGDVGLQILKNWLDACRG
jgi:glutamine amidotransferase